MSRSQGLFGSPVLMGNVLLQEGGGKVVEEGSWHFKNSCSEPSRELGAQQTLPLLSLQPPYEKGITIPIVPIRSVKVRVIRSRSKAGESRSCLQPWWGCWPKFHSPSQNQVFKQFLGEGANTRQWEAQWECQPSEAFLLPFCAPLPQGCVSLLLTATPASPLRGLSKGSLQHSAHMSKKLAMPRSFWPPRWPLANNWLTEGYESLAQLPLRWDMLQSIWWAPKEAETLPELIALSSTLPHSPIPSLFPLKAPPEKWVSQGFLFQGLLPSNPLRQSISSLKTANLCLGPSWLSYLWVSSPPLINYLKPMPLFPCPPECLAQKSLPCWVQTDKMYVFRCTMNLNVNQNPKVQIFKASLKKGVHSPQRDLNLTGVSHATSSQAGWYKPVIFLVFNCSTPPPSHLI